MSGKNDGIMLGLATLKAICPILFPSFLSMDSYELKALMHGPSYLLDAFMSLLALFLDSGGL